VTGEGLLDATSFTGKVVGRVLESARTGGIGVFVVAGDVAPGLSIDAASLVERYGPERALAEPAECLAELVETALAARRN
jgi:glycerate kinase